MSTAPIHRQLLSSGGIQSNPGGTDPVSSITLPTAAGVVSTPLVSGQNFYSSGTSAPILSLYTASQSWSTPKNYTYYLQIEKSLGAKAVVTLGHVGNQGRNLIGKVDLNPSPLNTSGNTIQASRPYYAQFPTSGKITNRATNTSSNYNSLQAVVKSLSWHGLIGQAAYTWSHNLDSFTSATLIPNYLPLKHFYSTADIDQQNVFTGYAVYQLPGLARSHDRFLNGWDLSGQFNFHSGQPFTITYTDNTGSGDGTQYANLALGGNPFAGASHKIVKSTSPYVGGHVNYLNPAVFQNTVATPSQGVAFTAPVAGTFGDERRNQLRGPGYADVDLSVIKNTHLTEQVNFQFRVEFNHLYNHPNLATPTTSIASSAVGQITGTVGGGGGPGVTPGEPFYAQIAGKIIF